MGADNLAVADEDLIYRVATVPPPDGDDAYSAATRVGPLSTRQVAELMDASEDAPPSGVRSISPLARPHPAETIARRTVDDTLPVMPAREHASLPISAYVVAIGAVYAVLISAAVYSFSR